MTVTNRSAISEGIVSLIKDADYNIINLECPVVNSPDTKKIVKDGPNLKCTEEAVSYLKDCGIDMVTLANNHLKDYGSKGIQDTLETCKKNGIEYVGAGMNLQEARVPKVIQVGGYKVGIVNVCENESSIAADCDPGSNPIDEINNYYDICNIKEKADKIIIIIHGGSEHFHYPTPGIKKRCHFYADLGVSAIVCHHTHCYSGYEVYHGVPIFYSLGNFFFDRKKRNSWLWNTGYLVQLRITNDKTDFRIYPYVQCKDEAHVNLMDYEQEQLFSVNIDKINEIIKNDSALQAKYREWLNKRYKDYISRTITWGNKFFEVAYKRNLVPACISKNKAMLLLNYIKCESHCDLMKLSLEKYINER